MKKSFIFKAFSAYQVVKVQFLSIKITANENMFRLHGCSEDDTITVLMICISSDMLKPFLLAQGFTLAETRKRRRKAKNTKEITRPICDWVHENQKIINTLEQLLGAVRKAEKRTQNRTYKNKTKIMNGLLE